MTKYEYVNPRGRVVRLATSTGNINLGPESTILLDEEVSHPYFVTKRVIEEVKAAPKKAAPKKAAAKKETVKKEEVAPKKEAKTDKE
jgi:hypothetical protein